MLLGALLLSAESTWATTFNVGSSVDAVDGNPGDGICETLPGNGLCTLRAALEEAGTMQSGDDITVTVPPGSYLLTLGSVIVPGGFSSRATIILAGSSASDTIIDGGGIVFQESREVTIQRVTVQNGEGLFISSIVALVEDSIIQNNEGPGVSHRNGITIVRSTIRGNMNPSPNGCGGGVFAPVFIDVVDSVITGNTAARGGGLCTGEFIAGVSVIRSIVSGNRATAGDGGGIYVTAQDAHLLDSVVSGNSAAGAGGGVSGAVVQATNSLIADNEALDGGGVVDGYLFLSNTTISGNRAARDGGGVYHSRLAYGTIASSTITANVAESGGGIWTVNLTLTIRNSILAGNTELGGQASDCGPEPYAGLVSDRYNVVGSSTCTVTGDSTGNLLGVDPRLGPLQNNGGSTFTHAVLAGSPAINAGNPAGCVDAADALLTVDQRGIASPQFGRCDIGAFEFACGNGVVDPGEECDDGTPGDGDCCSADCRFEAAGSSCADDGEPCTTDVCDEGGLCTHSFPLTSGCHAPSTSTTTFTTTTTTNTTTPTTATSTTTPSSSTTTSTTSTTTVVPTSSTTITSTTATSTITTTTTSPPRCEGEPAGPTFMSIRCRLEALLARVASETRIGSYQQKLLPPLEDAVARVNEAVQACAAGDLERAKTRLKKAGQRVDDYAHRLRSLRARKQLRNYAELGKELVAVGETILADTKALRRALSCAEDSSALQE